MPTDMDILGYHILVDKVSRPTSDDGRNILRAFEHEGFSCIYGEALRLVDTLMGGIPFRPLIEFSGCDVFVNHNSWVFCKVPDIQIPVEGRCGYLEFIIVTPRDDSATLAALRRICRSHFGQRLSNRLVRELHSYHEIETSYPMRRRNDPLILQQFDEVSDLEHPMERGPGKKKKRPDGFWLEEMVAGAFESVGQRSLVGVQAESDEIDVFISPFGFRTLIECKDSNLRLNDVSVARGKANRLGMSCVIMVVTSENIHPNLHRVLDVWSDQSSLSGPVPPVLAYVVKSKEGLNEFAAKFVQCSKLEELAIWIQAENSHPIVPWFSSTNSWGETISQASDWYGST